MTGRRLLGVFAHPDDEAYSAAGLLAHCAASGAKVEILCATRGEAGAVCEVEMLGAGGIAALRSDELAASCRAIGAREPTFLDWPDGGIAALDPDARVSQIAAHLDRFQPHLVVTLGRDGAYGHADHVAVTESVIAAVSARSGGDVRLLLCEFPRGLFAPLFRIMRRLGVALAPGIGPQSLGVAASQPQLRLDLSALPGAIEAKHGAVAAHRSQRPAEDPRSFLRPGLIDPLLEEEWYTVAVGPAVPPGAREPFAGM